MWTRLHDGMQMRLLKSLLLLQASGVLLHNFCWQTVKGL